MTTYSHSRLSTFEECKQKYKFRYIDKIKPDFEKSIEAHLGSSVHKALEWLYKSIISKSLPSIEDLIEEYVEYWEKNYQNSFKIVKENMNSEDYFNKGITFLINYYKEHYPFDDGTIAIEKEILITLDSEKNYRIKGFIDRLTFNLEKNRYEIHDYKTSSSLPNQEKFEKDRQLALYGIAIKEIYGNSRDIILIWHYLDHNKKIYSTRTNEQYEELKRDVVKLIEEIENTNEFPPYPSILCDWCEYKSKCPAWNKT